MTKINAKSDQIVTNDVPTLIVTPENGNLHEI